MKKLLLTGFEPFLDFSINPTKQIVEELDGTAINDYIIVGKILSVDFSKSGNEILDHFDSVTPDAVISLGLSGGRFKITPERIGINCNDGAKDNNGNQPVDEKIIEEGPDAIFSTLPIRKMVQSLTKNGLPADISNTAGTYLCNHVMYRMLYHIKINQLNVKSGFIHIPASHELAIQHGKIPSMSHADLVRGIQLCIEEM
ncbi:pyrrolidone-carboxylate peptidase [Niallia nealsonii AAU1]|nr:pyrrolidone-carboxylate peptidase [Niallia nealsonii AAU1]